LWRRSAAQGPDTRLRPGFSVQEVPGAERLYTVAMNHQRLKIVRHWRLDHAVLMIVSSLKQVILIFHFGYRSKVSELSDRVNFAITSSRVRAISPPTGGCWKTRFISVIHGRMLRAMKAHETFALRGLLLLLSRL
jgi:hypothetical protein